MERKVAVQIQFDNHCRSMLETAAESGFRYVSIGFGSYEGFSDEDWKEKITVLEDTLRKYGLRCVMTHSPYYDLRISAEVTYPKIDLSISRCLDASAALGAEIMAVHPRGCYTSGTRDEGKKDNYNLRGLISGDIIGCYSRGNEDYGRSFECNYNYWKPLAERAESLGCVIGIENLPVFPGWSMTFFSNDPDNQARLIDSLGAGACGIWDFGHAYLTDKGDVASLKKLGKRIKGLHVHDNSLKNDDHLIPFTGTMNWDEQISALSRTGFDGFVTLELAYEYGEKISGFMKQAYDAGCRLDEMLRG